MTFCGGEAFGPVFADKSGGWPYPCGEETRGNDGSTGQHDRDEGRSMEVLDNEELGEKCMDIVRELGVRGYG